MTSAPLPSSRTKLAFILFILMLFCLPSLHAQKTLSTVQKTISVDEIKTGMKGYALTVFSGIHPEEMGVEVLGVLHNTNGPKGDLILVKLTGEHAQYTGVVAGMSGSPVYFDGRLAGALSFRIGVFSKEPIAGVTPIADMLEINEIDRTPLQPSSFTLGKQTIENTRVSNGSGSNSAENVFSSEISKSITPIAAPLAFNGFTDNAVARFAPYFAAAGVQPVMGIGSTSHDPQPEPLEPGAAVSALLVTGDMSIAATCTVTYMDADRLLACGHPLLQFGAVEMPMAKAQVLATLPSPLNAFKIVNTTEPAGAFLQDRMKGIMGRFDTKARMIPLTLSLNSISAAGAKKERKIFHVEVLNNANLTPTAIMSVVYSALDGVNEYGEESTFLLNGKIAVTGYPDVEMHNLYAPTGGLPTAFQLAISVGDRFSRIYDNAAEQPKITGIELNLDMMQDRRTARLESARASATDVKPGDDITIEAVLKPYRGERITVSIPVKVPASAPKGTMRILVSDADTIDRTRRSVATQQKRTELGSTIAAINKEHKNDRLYVSVMESTTQALIEDKVMPNVPLSVLNVMDGMRTTQDMTTQGESVAGEYSIKLDHVITGAQVVTIQVK